MADGVEANPIGRAAAAVKNGFYRAVPSHLGDDALGLAGRVFRSGREGRHAIAFAVLSLLATPLDLMFQRAEADRYGAATSPNLPLILVCGPARSGTTLVASSLIRALPVSYFNNLTAVFPRSPITAGDLLRMKPRNTAVTTRSLYGRSAGWHGASDALPLWDRWMGNDRRHMPTDLSPETRTAMESFFGAYEEWLQLPLVAKNNSLNVVAHLIADTLPTAHFICVDRDPVYLAQSLLVARSFMYGDPTQPYGLVPEGPNSSDPVSSVIAQVRYHRDIAAKQQQHIGAQRFWRVDYDAFCREPDVLVARVATEILDGARPRLELAPFTPSRSVRIDQTAFSRFESELVPEVDS